VPILYHELAEARKDTISWQKTDGILQNGRELVCANIETKEMIAAKKSGGGNVENVVNPETVLCCMSCGGLIEHRL
jgi:hypothetical protein